MYIYTHNINLKNICTEKHGKGKYTKILAVVLSW